MKKALNSMCLCVLFLSHTPTFATEMAPYEYIVTTVQSASACLTLGSDSISVSVEKCGTTDHQQWMFVSSGSTLLYIKNKALSGSPQPMCLFANNQNSAKMAPCASSGGADYTSKRLWNRDGREHALLANKYISDLGKENYLQSNTSGQLLFGSREDSSAKWTITQPLYEEIIHTAGGTEKCLSLGDNLTSVTLQQCHGKDDQQWLFTPSGTRLYVKNKILVGSAQDMCLFAENPGSIKMATCASAGGTDYTSKRLWSRENNNPGLLSNSYISDLGKANYLQSNVREQLIFGQKEAPSAKWNIAQHYGYVRNFAKGQETCLALSQNNIDVEFSPCRSEARQDWRMSSIMTSYNKLTNRALASESTEKCLGATAKMVDCVGQGYTSERSWSYSRHFIPAASELGFILRNKYRNDIGKNEVLGFSGNTLRMVAASQTDAVTWHFQLQPPPIPRRPVVGDRKMLLLHTQYGDQPATDFAEVKKGFIGSPDDNYSFINAVHRASGKKLNVTAEAVTDLDMGARPVGCPADELRNKATALARAKGFDANYYDYLAVEIPPTSCPWGGLAAMPGSWAMGNASGWKPWMWQHEFGHSLGGPHATSLVGCPYRQEVVQVAGDGCVSSTAGDPSDTLNGGGSRLYPIPYLYYAGWLTDEQFPEVVSNGVYKMVPLFGEALSTTARGLHIFRSDGSYLTLEFRQPLPGFEAWPTHDPFVNGVIVRVARFNSSTVSNMLVDTTPGSANGMKDAPLALGKSIDDLLSGKQITVRQIDQTGATVEIRNIPGSLSTEPLRFERSYHNHIEEPAGVVVED
jgi:hypothetical protein